MRLNSACHRAISLGALSYLVATATATQAQTPSDTVRKLEEVFVTARKVEESLQDTPVSVAVFSTHELEQIGVTQAGDIAHFTPNLEMRNQTAGNDRYAVGIRGVSTADAVISLDPAVGIYHDGIYLARIAGLAFDIVDLERIEVLRGPQGTLFGRNTIGGAVNLISAKPDSEFGGKIDVSAGDRDSRRLRATLDTGEVGNFAAKLSYFNKSKDGPVKSFYNGDTLGDSSAEAYRVALRWTPSETFTADYVYNRSERESNVNQLQVGLMRSTQIAAGGAFYEQIAEAATPDRQSRLRTAFTDSKEATSDIDSHALTLEWLVNDKLSIKSITSYRDWVGISPNLDFGSYPATPNMLDLTGRYTGTGNVGFIPVGTLVSIFHSERYTEQDQFTQELQFTGSLLEDRLRYVAGLFYFEEEGFEDNPTSFVVPDLGSQVLGFGTSFVAGTPVFIYSADVKSYAAYSELQYDLTPALELTLGLRYSVDDKETSLTNTFDGEVKTFVADDTWNNFNPTFTASYRWNDQINTYAKVATGYRAGGFNVRASSEDTFRTPFDEEEVVSWEIGMKADLLDQTLRVNSAIFVMDYEDQQVTQFVPGTGGAATLIENAGSSTTSGLELEFVWLATSNLTVRGSYGYLDPEYDELVTTPVDLETGLTIGTENVDISDTASSPFAPKHSGSLVFEYQFPATRFGQLTARIDGSYSDEMAFVPQGSRLDSEEHTLVNARATLSDIPFGGDNSLLVSAWVRNLTDKEYAEYVTDFGLLGPTTLKYNEPRTWGVDLSYKF